MFPGSLQFDLGHQTGASHTIMSSTRDIPCKFFFSSIGCQHGADCLFSHALPAEAQTQLQAPGPASNPSPSNSGPAVKDQQSPKNEKTKAICKFYTAGYCRQGYKCPFRHEKVSRPPTSSSAQILSQKPRSLLTDYDVQQLRTSEIRSLKKRFPKRRDVDGENYQILYKISDPDWPYDAKSLSLQCTFTQFYPKDMFIVDIYDDDMLPSPTSRYIVRRMNEWISERFEINTKNNISELVFRPFLRWVDKEAETLFTEGLTVYKRQVMAKEAGLSFIPHQPSTEKPQPTQEQTTQKEGETDIVLNKEFTSQMEDISLQEQASGSNTEEGSEDEAIDRPETPPKLNPARRGTELRLRNLSLKENVGTLHLPLIRIGVKCTRCKTDHHVIVHSERPYVIVCDKCRSKMSLIYHANLMHISSNTAGFFDLDGCQPFDLLFPDCQAISTCLQCDKEIPIHGLQSDQERMFWCLNAVCHQKMIISIEKFSFILINSGVELKIGADAVIIAKKAREKKEMRIIADGKALPDNGACQHYKKSFRWFRFPCCGKLYPCDKCHDEKESDHEMELANRMICGFCSHEQGFSLTKPCIRCDSSMTRARTQHWEGGRGCRNKILMAKTDKQKFVGSNKTVSNKASDLQKKKGNKTTHLRHTT